MKRLILFPGVLAVALLAGDAHALSVQGDAPTVAPEPAATSAPATSAATSASPERPTAAPTVANTTASLGVTERTPLFIHLSLAAVAGVVTVPIGLYVASFLGGLSNQLIWAALPAILAMGFVAPTLTALAALFVGNWNEPKRFGFWLAWGATVLVNIVGLVIAGFAGMSLGMPVQLVVFSLVEGLALGGTSVGVMRLFEKKRPATAVRSTVPGVGETTLVPLAQVDF